MSAKAKPATIGAFVLGGIVLSVIGIAALATTAWFTEHATFVSHFDESVHGLEAGSQVKFQGVPVGTVKEIFIRIDLSDGSFSVPVSYEIDLNLLRSAEGGFVDLDNPRILRQQIANGLRAQLQMDSFVTGLLYVELTYLPEAEVPPLATIRPEHPEIPSSPSLFANLEREAGALLAQVHQIMGRAMEVLDELDVEAMSTAFIRTATSVEALATAPEIRGAFATVPGVTDRMNVTMAEFRLLAERITAAIDPLQLQIEGAGADLSVTLQTLRGAIASAQGMMTTDAGLGYQFEDALSSLARAADALRVLAESLERNPTMFIRGRTQDE
jgi:paraquat-inducible protein B